MVLIIVYALLIASFGGQALVNCSQDTLHRPPGSGLPRHGPPVRSKRWAARKVDSQVIAEAVTEKRRIPSDASSDDTVLEEGKQLVCDGPTDTCQPSSGDPLGFGAPCTINCEGMIFSGTCINSNGGHGYLCHRNGQEPHPGEESGGKPPVHEGGGGGHGIGELRRRTDNDDIELTAGPVLGRFKRWLGFDTNGERGPLDASTGNLATRDEKSDGIGARVKSRRWLRYNMRATSDDAMVGDKIRRDSSEEKRDPGIDVLDDLPEHFKREFEQHEAILRKDVNPRRVKFTGEPTGRRKRSEAGQHGPTRRDPDALLTTAPIVVFNPIGGGKGKPASAKKRDAVNKGVRISRKRDPENDDALTARTEKRDPETDHEDEQHARRDSDAQRERKRDCEGNDPPLLRTRRAVHAAPGPRLCPQPGTTPAVIGVAPAPGVGKTSSISGKRYLKKKGRAIRRDAAVAHQTGQLTQPNAGNSVGTVIGTPGMGGLPRTHHRRKRTPQTARNAAGNGQIVRRKAIHETIGHNVAKPGVRNGIVSPIGTPGIGSVPQTHPRRKRAPETARDVTGEAHIEREAVLGSGLEHEGEQSHELAAAAVRRDTDADAQCNGDGCPPEKPLRSRDQIGESAVQAPSGAKKRDAENPEDAGAEHHSAAVPRNADADPEKPIFQKTPGGEKRDFRNEDSEQYHRAVRRDAEPEEAPVYAGPPGPGIDGASRPGGPTKAPAVKKRDAWDEPGASSGVRGGIQLPGIGKKTSHHRKDKREFDLEGRTGDRSELPGVKKRDAWNEPGVSSGVSGEIRLPGIGKKTNPHRKEKREFSLEGETGHRRTRPVVKKRDASADFVGTGIIVPIDQPVVGKGRTTSKKREFGLEGRTGNSREHLVVKKRDAWDEPGVSTGVGGSIPLPGIGKKTSRPPKEKRLVAHDGPNPDGVGTGLTKRIRVSQGPVASPFVGSGPVVQLPSGPAGNKATPHRRKKRVLVHVQSNTTPSGNTVSRSRKKREFSDGKEHVEQHESAVRREAAPRSEGGSVGSIN